MGTGVCGVCGRDGFGVLGPRGVNGLADGLSTCFLTTGVVPVAPPAVAAVPVGTVAELLVGVGAAGVVFSDPALAITPAVGVLAMPVGVVVLLLGGAGETSGLGVASCCVCCCCTTGMGCGGGCSSRTGEVTTTGEVCGGGIVW